MLQGLIEVHRDVIIAKAKRMLADRCAPGAPALELESAIPQLLAQLSQAIEAEYSGRHPPDRIGPAAARQGRDLFALGFTLSEVVHHYGDICQAVTQVAMDEQATVPAREFHTLNRCLDTAIAEAVTEHGRLSAESLTRAEVERLGDLSHELRNTLNTAMMAFTLIKAGTVGINGSTGAVLDRTLMHLHHLVESTLSDVRLTTNQQRRQRVSVASFLQDIAAAARLDANYRGQQFIVEPIAPTLAVAVDPQLFASAVTNLLHNAFQYTPAGGRIILRTVRHNRRVRIEIEDQCGGLRQSWDDLSRPRGERRTVDRTGLGLGLAIARRVVRAHDGDLDVVDVPGAASHA